MPQKTSSKATKPSITLGIILLKPLTPHSAHPNSTLVPKLSKSRKGRNSFPRHYGGSASSVSPIPAKVNPPMSLLTLQLMFTGRNLEEERDKARERMAKHRERINQQEDLAAVSRARAREASRAFRQRNAANLAHRQRIIRMEAYGKKHGHRAWLQRQQLLEERRAEAQELADYRRHQEFLTKLLQEPLPSIILLHVGQICSCGYNDSCLVNLKGHSVTSHKRTNAQTGKMHFGNYNTKPNKKGIKKRWLAGILGPFPSAGPGRTPLRPTLARRTRNLLLGAQAFMHSSELALSWDSMESRHSLTTRRIERFKRVDFSLGQGRPHCVPPFRAEPGHENVEAFLARGGKLYVVTNGTLCGIFTSESRARKQIEGYPNGRWRKAKTWAVAIELWEEGCTVYHADRCPSHLDMDVAVSSPTPTSVEDAHAHNSRVFFHAGNSDIAYRSQKINASEPKFCVRAPTPSISPLLHSPRWLRRGTRSKRSLPTPTSSPLAMMDAVEAFSRMGVEDPFADALPPKQWVLAGVNKFFATRLDAISHILDQHMGHADLMGSRNVKKLRAFIRGEVYLAKPGEMQYLDDE
ncbi:hypothetical protein B0H13DRAFT_1915451 [Mycena leptocephala]|nr:hypothetical protein B0H13DRAFT_1915451 [Mycena leptocephala]